MMSPSRDLFPGIDQATGYIVRLLQTAAVSHIPRCCPIALVLGLSLMMQAEDRRNRWKCHSVDVAGVGPRSGRVCPILRCAISTVRRARRSPS